MPEKKPKPLFVELHALRSYPPSNLNRDDLGSPKSIVFGGERRVRVSSQCLKRTWRMSPFFHGELAEDQLGVRTQRMPEQVFNKLTPAFGDSALAGLEALFAALGKKAAKDDGGEEDGAEGEAGNDEKPEAAPAEAKATKTDHLLFVSQQEIDEIVAFAKAEKDDLSKVMKAGKKKAVDTKLLEKLRKKLKLHLAEKCKRNAVDVALFGRFLTSDEFGECNAALQVAHALGTQKLDLEYDYFTAVDDLQPSEDHGAGHLGETELCSSVLYEYAVCDVPLLVQNLGGDTALAAKAMKGIALAICRSIFEKAKRNGTAPHTPADFLEVVIRRDAPVSLANAFLKPVRPEKDKDVMDVSIRRLQEQQDKYDEAYGKDHVVERFVLDLRAEGKREYTSLDALAKGIEKRIAAEAHA